MFVHGYRSSVKRRRAAALRRRAAHRRRAPLRRLTAEALEDRTLLATFIELANMSAGEGVRLQGVAWQDQAGKSVSGAGDINRDGFDDLLVGAPVAVNFPAGTGQAYVVYGQAAGFQDVNLWELGATDDGFALFGTGAEDHAGFSVSGAGDVNGDGFHDFLIGAPGADRPTSGGELEGAGRSYLVFGGFATLPSLDSLDGSNGFLLQGTSLFDRLGASVSGAGDVNADGYDDVLVGAPVDDTFPGGVGTSYLIFGKPDSYRGTLNAFEITITGDGFPLPGLDAEDHSGASVSDAGDVNGDGFGDFVIGAPYADRPVANGELFGAGESYVVFGGTGGPPPLGSLDGSNGFKIEGFGAYDRAGYAVSSAGDVNGDGFDDLLIGAPADFTFPVHPGRGYVVFGKAGGFEPTLNLGSLDGSNGFAILGIDGVDHAAFSVSSGGDVNGDGFDDLLIGAPAADQGGGAATQFGVGEAYVVFGRGTPFPGAVALGLLGDDEGLVLTGEAAYDRAGYAVSSAGDVNGDGFDDFLVGAPVDTYYSFRAGRAYLVFGRDFTGRNPVLGDAADNVLAGDDQANTLLGAQGNDTLVGGGGGDVLRGGQGDDLLAIADVAFHKIDGGRGEDTLRLDGAGLHLDLTATPDNRLSGLERIDLTGSGDNQLTVGNAREVLNISDTSNRLIVNRDLGDVVVLGAGWQPDGTSSVDGRQYRVFRQGAAELFLQNLPPQVDLNGVNDPGIDFNAVFIEDGGPSLIVDNDLTVRDEDLIVSATARITNLLDPQTESLSVTVGNSGLQASYDASTGTLTLTGATLPLVYALVLRTLKYDNTSDQPNTTHRLIEVVVNDGLADSPAARSTVHIVDVNDAPVLSNFPAPRLAAIDEDDTDPPGNTVAQIVVDGSITDPDGAAVEAVAVISADNTHGTWQYATGGDWSDLGTPSLTAARLLGPQDKLRFVPLADYHGRAPLLFKAWDQTSGSVGEEADVSRSGGSTAFSSAAATATVLVRPVNDAPILDPSGAPTLTPIARENIRSPGDAVSAIVVGGSIADIDGPVIGAIAIIGVDEANGHWEHSADGQNWTRITAAETAAQLLRPGRRVRFVPNVGFFGTAQFEFRAWDRATGIDGGFADTTQNGGTTAFSTATDTAEIVVHPEDDPPTLDPIASPLVIAGVVTSDVNLSGISDGGAGVEPLTVTATSSNHAVLPDPAVNYTSPDGSGSLTLTPVPAASGWSLVTVTVTEDDGDAVAHTFAVSVGDNVARWQNPFNAKDVSNDGLVTPFDVLRIINELNNPFYGDSMGRLPNPPPVGFPPPYLDATGDGFVTPRDALLVINCLNETAGGEGEAAGPFAAPPQAAAATATAALAAWPAAGSAVDQGPASHDARPPGEAPAGSAAAVELDSPPAHPAALAARERLFADHPDRSIEPAGELESILDEFDAAALADWWR